MLDKSTVQLNFLPLADQSIRFRLWRQSLSPTDPLLPATMRFSLPQSHEGGERADYAISFQEQPNYASWEFECTDNRQLTLRYLFELLAAKSQTALPRQEVFVSNAFRRRVFFVLSRSKFGNQEAWLEPYYLDSSEQYGFLIDFTFHKSAEVEFSREVQRLSLSLDSSFRSNRNFYIDRYDKVRAFLRGTANKLFPLTSQTLTGSIELQTQFARLPISTLDPKIFLVGGEEKCDSQWKGLEKCGPLRPVSDELAFIMLYHKDHRIFAEDLYRALVGKAAGIAFQGFERIFKMRAVKFKAVEVQRWDRQQLADAVARIDEMTKEFKNLRPAVLMIEDRDQSPIYYAAKFEFLKRDIPLQVVSIQLIKRKDSFRWSVSNIALQIFAKLGGQPWKVLPSHSRCLIMGIGQAHRLGVEGVEKYFSYCVATDSSGLYKRIAVLGNSATLSAYLDELKKSLIRELRTVAPQAYDYCAIHVPFKVKKAEINAIDAAVTEVANSENHSQVRFVVIKINDDHKFFGYADTNSRVPREGAVACLSAKTGSYLVWFEGQRDDKDVLRKRVAGPLHIQFLWPRTDLGTAEQVKFIQDVFNLSGTNWRGFNAKSTPISTYYCRLVARFVAEFPAELSRIEGSQEPWFL